MKSSAKKVELASVDDLFSTEESRADAPRERVMEIPLSELHPFKNHPFKVKDDEAMMETADSVRQYPAFASLTEKVKMPFVLQSMSWNALGIFDADKQQMPPENSEPTNTASMSVPLQIVRHWRVRHRENRQRRNRCRELQHN